MMYTPEQILEEARSSRIQAIKILRDRTGLGLKEAKDMIDQALSYGNPRQGINLLAKLMGYPQVPAGVEHKASYSVLTKVDGEVAFEILLDGYSNVLWIKANGSSVVVPVSSFEPLLEALGNVRTVLHPYFPAMA